MNILSAIMPVWVRLFALALMFAIVFVYGQMRGERIAGQRHIDYVTAQATASAKLVQAHEKIVIETQTKYVDRIKTIYLSGEKIETKIPQFITPVDNADCSIHAGFVRIYNAAWSSDAAITPGDTDREPTGLSIADVAEADTTNATSCRAWRDQALGWREFYSHIRSASGE